MLGLVGSVVVSWLFQSQWVAPDPSLMAVIFVAAVGATGLIIAQRTIFPARAPRISPGVPAPSGSDQRRDHGGGANDGSEARQAECGTAVE